MPETKYKVGYRKPPKKSQFQKGKSGNPKGRSKRENSFKNLQRIIEDELLEVVTIMVNGKPCKMTRNEAVLRAQFNAAMTAKSGAAAHYLGLAHRYLPTHQTLEDMMKGRKVFSWTAEDEEQTSKEKLLEGTTVDYIDKS
jgi:hypothetical protein